MMTRALCLAIVAPGVLLSLTAATVRAQDADARPPYEVRLTYRCIAGAPSSDVCRIRGTTPAVAVPGSVVVTPPNGSPLTVGLADVIQLDERAGTRSRWPEGAAVGFVAGAGGTMLLLAGAFSYGSFCDYTKDQDAMGWAGCLGIAGGVGVATGLLGGLVGTRLRTPRLRKIDPSQLFDGR